jgi:hypothetical protein
MSFASLADVHILSLRVALLIFFEHFWSDIIGMLMYLAALGE